MAFTEPLDLETLLLANFAGTSEIFIFVATIAITFLAAKFRMPNGIAIPLFAIFATIMMGTVIAGSFTMLYVIILILTSFFLFFSITKNF